MDVLIVPYRGVNPALQDLVGGQIKGMFVGVAVADEFIRAGKLHAVAVSTRNRLKSAPELPTIAEQGYPEFEYVTFYGLGAPKATPTPIVQRLNQDINRALALADVRAKIDGTGAEIAGGSADAFAAVLKDNMSKMKRIISDAGIKPVN